MSDNTTLDSEVAKSVTNSATAYSRANSVSELARKAQYALLGALGENVTGTINSQTKAVLGASIALLRGESAEDVSAYTGDSKAEMRAELEAAFSERFPEDVETPEIEGRTSIGPILPYILAYASIVEEVDATEVEGYEPYSSD